jgi:uncharacterized protein involved in exopolysaccharide biosynthesis
MTIDERLSRIEHVTAGLDEPRRKYLEENRQLWRDTQRQIDDLSRRIADTNAAITRLPDQTLAADQRLEEKISRLAEESREQDRRLGERIDKLVSAMGVFLAKQNPT